jgi:PAS domain S-box-containing protein
MDDINNKKFEPVKDLLEKNPELLKTQKEPYNLYETVEGLKTCEPFIIDTAWIIDKHERLVYISPSVTDLTGYSPKEAMDLSPEDVLTETSYEKLHNLIRENPLKESGETLNIELEIIRKDCSILQTNIIYSCVFNENKDLLAYQGVMRDITSQKQLETDLKSSEEKFRVLADQSVFGIFMLKNGKIIYVNQAAEKLLEFSAKELCSWKSMEFVKLVDIDDIKQTITEFQNRMAGEHGSPKHREYRLTTKSGKTKWVMVHSARMELDGEFCIIVTVIDITPRKKALELISNQKDLAIKLSSASGLDETLDLCLDTAINISGMDSGGIYIVDESTGDIDLVRHKGLSEEFIGQTSHYDSDSRHANIIKTGKPVYHKFEHTGDVFSEAQKNEKILALAIVPVLNEEKVLACINVASHKFTKISQTIREPLETIAVQTGSVIARAKAREALKLSEELFAKIFMSNPIASSITDIDEGRIILSNTSFSNLFGYESKEINGRTTREMELWYDPEDRERIKEIMLEKGSLKDLEVKLRHKSGTILDVYFYAEMTEYLGEPHVLTMAVDVTEMKMMEEEIIKSTKLESLGVFAGGIAHDFNNYLTAILGNVNLVMTTVAPDSQNAFLLEEAENAIMRAKDLTGQLLTFSKGGEPIKKPTAIDMLIKESSSFALRGSNVKCEISCPSDLWEANIDKGQISQVIYNLVINADQAMAEGGVICVDINNIFCDDKSELVCLGFEEGKYINVTLKDQGIGIPQKQLEKIFDPFFTTKQKGSGLGLSTCYSIIKKHKGHIKAESELGAGTSFNIFLPALDEKVKDRPKIEENAVKGHGKVLIMDDDKTIRTLAANMLEHLGYDPDTTENGEQAVEKYKEALISGEKYKAVVLDLTVPGGMGGKQALEKLLEFDPETRAIVSSGYSIDPVMAEHESYGFKGMLAKPYVMKLLATELYKVINSD